MTPTAPLTAWADELALMFAKQRTHGSVYMDGRHNPLPSEVIKARRFVEDHAAAVRAEAIQNAPILKFAELDRVRAEADVLRAAIPEDPWVPVAGHMWECYRCRVPVMGDTRPDPLTGHDIECEWLAARAAMQSK